MRVTSNQVMINALTADKSRSIPYSNLVGKSVSGVVTAVEGNRITILQNGTSLNLLNESGTPFVLNQKVNLLITGMRDGTLLATVNSETAQTEMVDDVLMKFNGDSGSREIVEAMLKFSVPLTQQNFNTMKQNMGTIKIFLSEMAIAETGVESIDVEKAIKENVLELLKNASEVPRGESAESTISMKMSPTSAEATGGADVAGPEMAIPTAKNVPASAESNPLQMTDKAELPVKSEPEMDQFSTKVDLNTGETERPPVVKTGSDGVKLDEHVKAELNDLKGDASQPREKGELETIRSMIGELVGDLEKSSETALKEGMLKLAQAFDLEVDALMTKSEIELTFKNLYLALQLRGDEQSIGQSFTNLVKLINSMSLPDEALQEISMLLNQEGDDVERLMTLANILNKATGEEETRMKLDKEIVFIKEGSQIAKQINEPLFFIQMPVEIESELHTVELYYRRKKKGDPEEDYTILVALKTQNLEEVRCLIEKKKDYYTLNFKLKTEAIKDYFEGNDEILKSQLDSKNVKLRFTVESDASFELEEAPKMGLLDLRI